MDDKKKTTDGTYASLRGFHRAVPIILAAIGVFIAVCFITEATGALGGGIAGFLLGLFSYGAYAIPVLICLHGLFYAHDLHERCVVSRTVFSALTVLIIAAVEYAVIYWSSEPVFDPVGFYNLGSTGGFIGSILAFGIMKIFGPVGLVIICVAVVAIYITFFFARSSSAAGRAALSVLSVIADACAAVERGIKGIFRSIKKARADKREQEAKERTGELADDDFFAVDNGMEKLEITELGIKEVRSSEDIEKNPTLHGTVYHKSAVKGEDIPREEREMREEPVTVGGDRPRRRVVDLTYGLDDEILHGGSAPEGKEDIIYEADEPVKERRSYGEDSAEAVFTRDFDPFDFATGEREASRLSSGAAPREEKRGISEMTTPISELTEEDVLAARRRAAFEMRKKLIIENARGAARAEQRAEPVAEERPAPTVEKAAEPVIEKAAEPVAESRVTDSPFRPRESGKSVEFTVSKPAVERREPVEHESVTVTYGKPEHGESDTEAAAAAIAEMVAQSNPAYARSTNMAGTYTVIKEDAPTLKAEPTELPKEEPEAAMEVDEVEETADGVTEVASEPSVEIRSEPLCDAGSSYRRAAGFTAVINEYTTAETPSAAPAREEFKPYTPPTVEDAAPVRNEVETLRVERTMIAPMPEAEETAEESDDRSYDERRGFTVIGEGVPESELATAEEQDETGDGTIVWSNADDEIDGQAEDEGSEGTEIFSFEDDEEDEDANEASGDVSEIFGEEDDGEDGAEAEIPPEEQNPDVLRMRAQFPFLDPIPTAPAAEGADTAEEDEEDEEIIAPPVTEAAVEEEYEDESEEDEPPFDTDDIADLVEAPVEEPKPKRPTYENYEFPPIDLLSLESTSQSEEEIREEKQANADKLIETLASFGVTAAIKGVDRGPRITRYEVVPAKGVKVSSILGLSDDIALNLAAESIRMEAPIPGKSAVGVEIPNKKSATVRLRELLETEDFISSRSKTTVCMGKDVAGQPIIADIAKMPHALIAGATGMGKSVCMNSLIISMLYKARPDEVKFIMIDPKQVEFTMYNGIPHLLVPIVNDVKQAAGTLMWAVEEMERRYNTLQQHCVRNIDNYNEKVAEHPEIGEKMHRIVIVIDEFAELIMQVKNPVESLVIRIAQKARAAGIHLIIGTQKPVKEVITGLIKSNIPTKMSCKVMSQRDAILIFDSAGAEKLLDKGDMLIAFANSPKPQRVQCAFVSDGEVEAVMEHLKRFSDGSNYDESVMEDIKRAADKCSKKNGGSDYDDGDDDRDESGGEGFLNDKQFLDAVEVAVSTGKISTSLIQRKISIGYGKAAKFIDVMEDMGIVSEPNGQKPRDVLITKDEWREKLARTMYD